MNVILNVVEAFIRLVKREVHADAVLVAADDLFEVKRTPSVLLQGPVLTENRARRTPARLLERDVPALSYEECKAPRLYHLHFDIVVTTASEPELLEFQERIARFYQVHPVLGNCAMLRILLLSSRLRALSHASLLVYQASRAPFHACNATLQAYIASSHACNVTMQPSIGAPPPYVATM